MKCCSKAAQALCNYRKYCEPDALFEDDSECDDFNQYVAGRVLTDADDFSPPVTRLVVTNADLIRTMTDEALVDLLWQFIEGNYEDVLPFCKTLEECVKALETNGITAEMSKRCLLEKLQQAL